MGEGLKRAIRAAKRTQPLFDVLTPDPVGEILGTGFQRFAVHRFELNGLLKITGDSLEILAVVSENEDRGNFRDFIDACKDRFREVIVWHIDNPIVESALSRYGFVATQKFERDERIPGMIWTS
jgi:hypothetical protein